MGGNVNEVSREEITARRTEARAKVFREVCAKANLSPAHLAAMEPDRMLAVVTEHSGKAVSNADVLARYVKDFAAAELKHGS